MQTDETIHIRPGTPEDETFIVSWIPRLTDFGPPEWRNVYDMEHLDTKIILETIKAGPEGTAIFIAEDLHPY